MTINNFSNHTSDVKIHYNVYLKDVNTYDYFTVDYLEEDLLHLSLNIRKRETYKKAKVTNIGYNKAKECIQVDAEI